ncbi:MAG: class I SAM-dependent methyltransferase [Cyclonatronaceae bacterium]
MNSYDQFRHDHYYRRLGTLTGRVLELGFGDGKSFGHYNSEADVSALEKKKKWVERTAENDNDYRPGKLTLVHGVAEKIPFDDHTFDFVTTSFVLCSVNSQREAIREIYRVLKPAGRYIAIEHTLSNNRLFRGIQHVVAKPLSKIAGNCHLNSDPVAVIMMEDFRILETVYFPFYLEPPLFIEAEKVQATDAIADVKKV